MNITEITASTCHMLSPVDLANWALAQVVKQGAFSYDPERGCLYRGPDNLKCAAGFCISDAEYDGKLMEGIRLNSLVAGHHFTCGITNKFSDEQVKALCYAQRLHDDYARKLASGISSLIQQHGGELPIIAAEALTKSVFEEFVSKSVVTEAQIFWG
jgi:hypothetical protein